MSNHFGIRKVTFEFDTLCKVVIMDERMILYDPFGQDITYTYIKEWRRGLESWESVAVRFYHAHKAEAGL